MVRMLVLGTAAGVGEARTCGLEVAGEFEL